jgi:ribonucleoside-diphosphate reductase alpha chain
MKREARLAANQWADLLGIARPKAITCVKPSGTVSQLVNSSSGLHPRYSKVYQRRVQITKTDPLADMLIDQGVSYEEVNGDTWAFKFCVEGPQSSVYRDDRTAIEQLEHWLTYKKYWCDHNPSVTIYVGDNEWDEVGQWVWSNWDHIGGLSFFPKISGTMPFQPYEELDEPFVVPEIDFSQLPRFEVVDSTEGSKELACAGGACEL